MKRLFAALLTLTMALTLTACGHTATLPVQTEETAGTTAGTSATTQTTTADTAATTTVTTTGRVKDFAALQAQLQDRVEEKTNEDGSVLVELKTDTPDPETGKTKATTGAAVPTMPKTTRRSTTTSRSTAAPATVTTRDGVTAPTAATTTTTAKTAPQFSYVSGQTHRAVPLTERYVYTTLSAQQQEWYRLIDKAVRNLDAEVEFDVNIAEDRRYYVYFAYMFDNPEHFYLANTLTLFNHGDGTSSIVFSYAVSKEECCRYGSSTPRVTDELRASIRAKKATFDAEVARILSTIPANAPDVWKERLIYDRILMDGQYNLGAKWDGLAEDNWTAYGLLVNKYGVCESYSEAFQTLCLAAGIRCTGVVGTAGGGHKWNCVELDGEWYMCDITFDDPIGGEAGAAYHYYFNLTSREMQARNHDWSNCDFSVPDCLGTKYDFDAYFGESRW